MNDKSFRGSLFFFLIFFTTVISEPLTKEQSVLVVEKIFGEHGINLPPLSLLFLEDLFYALEHASPYQQMYACKKAAVILEDELRDQQLYLNNVLSNEKEYAEHNAKIITIQKEHFERCARLFYQNIQWYTCIIGWLTNSIDTVYSFFMCIFSKHKQTRIITLAQYLVRYARLERTEILTDHVKTLALLNQHNQNTVPLIIRFWDYPRYRHRLLNNIKKFQIGAQPAASVAFDVAEEVGTDVATKAAEEGSLEGVLTAQEAADLATADAQLLEDISPDLENLFSNTQPLANQTTTDITNIAKNLPSVESSNALEETALENIETAHEATVQANKSLRQIYNETKTSIYRYFTDTDKQWASTKFLNNAIEKVSISKNTLSPLGQTMQGLDRAEQIVAPSALKALESVRGMASSLGEKCEGLYNKLPWRSVVSVTDDATPAEGSLAAKEIEIFGENGQEGWQEQIAEFQKTKASMIRPLTEDAAAAEAAQDAQQAQLLKEYAPLKLQWTKARIIDAFSHPLDSLATGAKTVVVTGIKTAMKFSVRNIYTYLMEKAWGKMLIDMIEQCEMMMGAQMATTWESEDDAKIFTALSQERNKLITQFNQFISSLSAQRQIALNQINAQYTAKIAQITSQFFLTPTKEGTYLLQGLLPDLLTAEKQLLSSSLVNSTNKQFFVSNSLQDDQIFSLSSMVAPSGNCLLQWYNPYRSGNWEFCSADYSTVTQSPVTSFIQYLIQSCSSQTFPNGDPSLILQNMIFTEYIPPIKKNSNGIESYTITIECIFLSNPTTPFMMGIVFNGARWISGVTDLHHQHRLFCVYTSPEQAQGTYSVGFAETLYLVPNFFNNTQTPVTNATIPGGVNALSPVFQLLCPNQLASLTSSTHTLFNPIPNPLATIQALEVGVPYIFTITTEPTSVTLAITKKDGTKIFPSASLSSSTQASNTTTTLSENQINLLNGITYLYHNIGFISAGCSTQFIVKNPADLTYTSDQIQQIENALTSGISS